MSLFDWLLRRRWGARSQAGAYLKRGWAYSEKGELDKAIADFTQAIRLAPRKCIGCGRINRGIGILRRGAFLCLDCATGRGLKVGVLTDVVTAAWDAHAAYLSRGRAFHAKGNFDAAIKDFGELLSGPPAGERPAPLSSLPLPDAQDAHFDRGCAYLDKGEIGSAIDDFTQVIALGVKSTPLKCRAYVKRGIAYAGRGDIDAAIQDFSEVIMLKTTHYSAFRLEPDGSPIETPRCDCGRPAFPEGLCDRCRTGLEEGGTPWSCRVCGAVVPTRGGLIIGDRYVCDDCLRARAVLEAGPAAYVHRASAYVKQGDYNKALADLDEAILMKPDYADAYYNRAQVNEMQGRKDEAAVDLAKATELDTHPGDKGGSRAR